MVCAKMSCELVIGFHCALSCLLPSCIQPPTLGASRFANLRAGIRFNYMSACALLAMGIACARGRLTYRILCISVILIVSIEIHTDMMSIEDVCMQHTVQYG